MGKESKQKLGRKNLWRALTGCTMAVLLAVFGLVTGLVLPLSADTEPEPVSHLGQWIDYNWGSTSPLSAYCIWEYDGDYYYSHSGNSSSSLQYKLNQETMQWENYNWGKYYPSNGSCFWECDGNYFFSYDNQQLLLFGSKAKRWLNFDGWGISSLYGYNIWQYGEDYYYITPSRYSDEPWCYKLNIDILKWEPCSDWDDSSKRPVYGQYIWECDGDYYYSQGSNQYKLNQETMQWEDYKDWGYYFNCTDVWQYNGDYYYSYRSSQYKLNKTTMKWEKYTGWDKSFQGTYVWECNGNYYYSYDNSTQYILHQAHTAGETITTPATCTTSGERTCVCAECGDTYTEEIPAPGHMVGEWETTVAPTCTEAGTKVQKCVTCGTVLDTQSIPALGHTWDDGVGAAPTCTAEGNMLYTCTVCHTTETRTEDATGHTAGEWVTVQEPTCTENGIQEKHCTECHVVLETDHDTLTATGHTNGEWVTVQEATCIEDGLKNLHCAHCDEVIETAPIPATGEHVWGGYEITKKATTEAPGEKARHCTVCGTIDEDSRTVVPKLEPKKNGTVWIIVGAAVAVGGLGVMLAFLIKRSRQKVDVEFIRKV